MMAGNYLAFESPGKSLAFESLAKYLSNKLTLGKRGALMPK